MEIRYGAVAEAYLFAFISLRALDGLFKFQTFSFKWILHTFFKITLIQFIF